MKVGDLVRDKVTKAENTVGLVMEIGEPHPQSWYPQQVAVLHRDGLAYAWSILRLEVISESR